MAARLRAVPDPVRCGLLAAALAVAYLVVAPPSADLAAQLYRAGLFKRQGFTLWDGNWYGGHHTPGYSVLFPPVAAALGPQLAGAVAMVVAAILFALLVRDHFGTVGRAGALWFATGTATVLLTGRLAFGFGVAFGLAAVLALERGRTVAGGALAALTSLASPVAGIFVVLAGGAAALATRERRGGGLAVAAGAAVPVLALALAFPEGGDEPFVPSAFIPLAAFCVLALVVLPRTERVLRTGAGLYALAGVAAFLLPTPVGGTVVRLGALVAGPLAACALWSGHRRLLALLVLPALWWQCLPAVHDVATASGDPSVRADYYRPLLAELDSRPGPPGRLEIPFTRQHWEAARVAPHVPLARGWERQLDRRDNGLFYRPGLTPAAYRSWLDALAVRWVAVPDARLDDSARAEVALIDRGLPYLRLVWRGAHWTLYSVRAPMPLASGAATATALGEDSFALRARRPGGTLVRVRFTPYWALAAGSGCVAPAGRWTLVQARRPGPIRVATRFAFGRIRADSARCR